MKPRSSSGCSADTDTSAATSEQQGNGFRIEHELIDARLAAYTVENRIRRIELQNEMSRIEEDLQTAETFGSARQRSDLNRSLDRLMLEGERLEIDLRIRQLETDLALRDLALQEEMQEQIASGTTPPAENQWEIDRRR